MAMARRGSIVALVAILAIARATGTARADGDDGSIFAGAFEPDPPEPISTPDLILGVGYGSELLVGSAALGFAWGVRTGSGPRVKRVMVGVERRLTLKGFGSDPETVPTRFTATFGWLDGELYDLGLDLGVSVTTTERFGGFGRLTFGAHGIGVRLTFGGDTDRDTPDFFGGLDLVLDLGRRTGRI
jgi:hypothetical protein